MLATAALSEIALSELDGITISAVGSSAGSAAVSGVAFATDNSIATSAGSASVGATGASVANAVGTTAGLLHNSAISEGALSEEPFSGETQDRTGAEVIGISLSIAMATGISVGASSVDGITPGVVTPASRIITLPLRGRVLVLALRSRVQDVPGQTRSVSVFAESRVIRLSAVKNVAL